MSGDHGRFPAGRTRARTGTFRNGASRTRTGDLLGAIQALSQLSYSPTTAPRARRRRRQPKCSRRVTERSMVWAHMGLLDDAIREHLELKRRRGADPTEVAREQRAALDPLSDGGPSSKLDLGTEEHRPDQPVASDAGFLPVEETGQPRAASDHAGIAP